MIREYFEKKYIQQLRYDTPSDPLLLYVDEKGPITTKTPGGSSWSSVQVKGEMAQKTKGILNVFGAYDYTNDKIHVHYYKKKGSVNLRYYFFIVFINKQLNPLFYMF